MKITVKYDVPTPSQEQIDKYLENSGWRVRSDHDASGTEPLKTGKIRFWENEIGLVTATCPEWMSDFQYRAYDSIAKLSDIEGRSQMLVYIDIMAGVGPYANNQTALDAHAREISRLMRLHSWYKLWLENATRLLSNIQLIAPWETPTYGLVKDFNDRFWKEKVPE